MKNNNKSKIQIITNWKIRNRMIHQKVYNIKNKVWKISNRMIHKKV